MDNAAARALIALNNQFYAMHAASFSATRSAPWDGWRMVTELARKREQPIRHVLDVACGNLRFEQFLLGELPHSPIAIHAVDSCSELVRDPRGALPDTMQLIYHQRDVLASLLDADSDPLSDIPVCDLTVCFGFMHHVPGFDLRARLFADLVDHTAPGGIIVVSLWQFMNDKRLARKARAADETARTHGLYLDDPDRPISITEHLETGDHFLGWQADPSPLRYCHHCDQGEIDELVAFVGGNAREVARWAADGSSGTLNQYIALERR